MPITIGTAKDNTTKPFRPDVNHEKGIMKCKLIINLVNDTEKINTNETRHEDNHIVFFNRENLCPKNNPKRTNINMPEIVAIK